MNRKDSLPIAEFRLNELNSLDEKGLVKLALNNFKT